MEIEPILILRREDLCREKTDKPTASIQIEDFVLSRDLIRTNSLIMFIDINGDTKLLKNRWGNKGLITKPTQDKFMILFKGVDEFVEVDGPIEKIIKDLKLDRGYNNYSREGAIIIKYEKLYEINVEGKETYHNI